MFGKIFQPSRFLATRLAVINPQASADWKVTFREKGSVYFCNLTCHRIALAQTYAKYLFRIKAKPHKTTFTDSKKV